MTQKKIELVSDYEDCCHYLPGDVWSSCVVATVGSDHARDRINSDDAFSICELDCGLIAVVSDGAGSAPNGATGALMIVGGMVEHFRSLFGDSSFLEINFADETYWREQFEDAIEKTRLRICDGGINGEELVQILRKYHATCVCGLVDYNGLGVIAHIGDGLGIALRTNNEKDEDVFLEASSSMPENGEYANETFFYTQSEWRRHLRLTFFRGARHVVLTTDGLAPALMRGRASLNKEIIESVTNVVESRANYSGAIAIYNWITSQDIRNISSDDKTLIWLTRSHGDN